ncbi:hypothetical protein JCM9492_10730 [Aquifex pyrophilus]
MFRYYAIEDEHFKGLLWNGKLDEDLDEVMEQFQLLTPFKQYELVKYIKEKKVYPSLGKLTEAFRVSEEEGRAFLNNPFREVLIPTVNDGEGKLVRAITVEGLSKVITNAEHLKSSLNVIKDFLGFGFFAFFDEFFSGESYMLSLTLSLYVENLPQDLLFTGKIDREGRIYEANGIPKKRKLAQKYGYRLIPPSRLSNVRDIKAWLDAERYDVPLFITKTTQNYEGEFRSFLKSLLIENVDKVLENLELFNAIGEETVLMITGRLEPKESVWKEKVGDFYRRIKKIEEKLSGREVYHIGINGASAFAFACGTIYGSYKPFVFYHFQNGEYIPLKVDNVRSLKERLKEYESIKYTYEEGGEKLVVILSLSHHSAEADVKAYTKALNPSYLIVRHKKSGNLAPEEMIKVSREIASLIQDIREKKSVREFHFFFSAPVAVCFMVGVAFGYYSPGYIYNYEKPYGYERVLKLEDIRNIREGNIFEIYRKA